jgi:PAS domain S-box-containing protein
MTNQSLVLVEKAWSQYVESGKIDPGILRPEVANSWQRCRSLKVDPFREADGGVNQLELRQRLYAKQRLMKAARPFMENLYHFVRASGFQVILTDEHGFLLDVLGDSDIVSQTRPVHLCPGGDWSEASKGTNAIGTAIAEGKPVQIHAWEHFSQQLHFLTCSAAPIFDADGSMLGVLDISGNYRFANSHTLGMVVAGVKAIENQLSLQHATQKLYLAYRYTNAMLESMSDGLLSIDTNGIITEINAKGAELFGITPGLAKGRHVAQVYKHPPVLQLLLDGVEYQNREVVIDRTGRKIHSSGSLIRDDSGGVIGAVAVFRENATRNSQPARRPALPPQRYTFDDIIGQSSAITELKEWARLAASSPSTVLIKGESGTGKELFAQAIHNASPRRDRPFVAINSAALPEALVESELFGHDEGAFTGSRKGGQAGKFEIAEGGTVFLDEIGDMPLGVQAKLLRVIQEKKVVRVGSSQERHVDIRIIAATHKDLHAEVRRGTFRQDLYYRLNVLEIRVPALRERLVDIPALTAHLIQKLAANLNRPEIRIDHNFLSTLQTHTWPGNVRELENTLERAIVRVGADGILKAEILDFPEGESEQQPGLSSIAGKSARRGDTEIKSLRDSEKDLIAEALAVYEGNIRKASAKLGIGRNTFYRKMKEYGIS